MLPRFLLRLLRVSCTAAASPATSALTAAATGAAPPVGRRRSVAEAVDLVGVDLLIAHAVAVLVEISHRLLEESRLGIALRNGAFGDIELVLAHAGEHERA